ncbi:MAG: substrate-binding domain-containing protein [Clostridiales bacterium]|nr:substrate-binding domain-containing protein [Clostridiales bacterium]
MTGKNNIPIIVEDKYTVSNWCKETLLSLKKEAHKSKFTLEEISAGDIGGLKDKTVMILGTDGAWIEKTIQKVLSQNAKPMLLCAEPMDFGNNIYSISPDRIDTMICCIRYLLEAGRKQIALFGINEKATSDVIKRKAFISCIKEFSLNSFTEQDIYCNDGAIDKCFESFLPSADKYNAVICANDAAAIYLINRIKECGKTVPGDLFVIGNGNTKLGSMVSPTLTTITLNVIQVAHHAIRLYRYLFNQNPLHSLHVTIPTEILVRESTGGFKDEQLTSKQSDIPKNNNSVSDKFFSDSEIREFFILENMFNDCDNIDYRIISGLMNNKSQESLADELYISINTLQYRIKKMYVKLGIGRWEQFVKLLEKYSIKL